MNEQEINQEYAHQLQLELVQTLKRIFAGQRWIYPPPEMVSTKSQIVVFGDDGCIKGLTDRGVKIVQSWSRPGMHIRWGMHKHNCYRLVTIPLCDDHGGWNSNLLTVPLLWRCPVCGGPRGNVQNGYSYDGSRRLECDMWLNPCGHVDVYSAVREEAKKYPYRPVWCETTPYTTPEHLDYIEGQELAWIRANRKEQK